ncbi:MAG: CHAD domain-containing protein [Acidimicrobiales bacterium]
MASVSDVHLDERESATAGFRRVLAHLAGEIELNRPAVIEDADPEHLHDLRIAVRRTRSLLAESDSVLPSDVRRAHQRAFRRLGRQTGPVRDLDVFQQVWHREVGRRALADDAGLGKVTLELAARRDAAHAELSRLLASEETRAMLEGWRRWLADPSVPADPAARLGPTVVERIERAHEHLLRGGRAIRPDSPSTRLHDLRKDAKRVRYLIECFGSLLQAKAKKAFVTELKALQDNLGAHQDAEVQLDLLRLLARDLHAAGAVDTDTLLHAGRISEAMLGRQASERQAFDGRFARYDTRRNRRALADLLGPIR